VLFTPGRVFFLFMLSLLELLGIPKVKQLPPGNPDDEGSPEGAR